MSYQYDYNELFDFNETDNFLNNLSSSISSISPESLDDKNDYMNNLDFDYQPKNSGVQMNQVQMNFTDSIDSDNKINMSNSLNNSLNTSMSMNDVFDSQGSISSQNDVTPVSQPSTETSPEIKEELDDSLLNSRSTTINPKKGGNKKKDKTSHNMIEKKYRTNINSKILLLRDAVPSLRIASGKSSMKVEDLEGLSPASKLNKASVLTKATEYIKHLENKNELLSQQIMNLQRVIQQGNMNQSQSIQMQIQQPPRQQYPIQNQPMSQSSSSNYEFDMYNYPLDVQVEQQPTSGPNKYLLGGMAAVMGTSMFTGPDEIRGLSAIPLPIIKPLISLLSNPITNNLWYVLKIILIVGCIGNLLLPQLFNNGPKETIKTGSIKNLVMVNLGLRLPQSIDNKVKHQIISRLSGKSPTSPNTLFQDFVYLSSLESNFENVYLWLLLTSIIIAKYPIMKNLLSMSINMRYSLILNLQHPEDKHLNNLSQLVKVDGLVMFKSNVISRLTNLINRKPINEGIVDDSNYLKFIEVYQNFKHQDGDFYELIFNWRIIDILNDLILVYLDNNFELNNKLSKDIKLIENLIEKTNSKSGKNFLQQFKVIIDSKKVGDLIKSVNEKINSKVEEISIELNGIDLTDDESWSSEETEIEEVEEKSSLKKIDPKFLSSLNVISPEEFIIITSSIIINNQQTKFLKYLQHKLPLSLISFTMLFKLVDTLNEDDLQIDIILNNLKDWVKNNNLINDDLKIKLNENLIKKGMVVNGSED
ncbi:transcription factor Cph2p [[Candida] jaroonii]|uniref:Transcription factor Cph2p n=1 Tax=[Candida] jaroonii TaxID=467808 RepID=A0ACA9Y8Z0_9ASCO|nr:transcription factor Cph2p [[Candida] jaroonii]